jgi:hypothetical protein
MKKIKVTRKLVEESIEVYLLKGFGVVEIALHKFHNNTEKQGEPSYASKFVIFWTNDTNVWTITKLVSLH